MKPTESNQINKPTLNVHGMRFKTWLYFFVLTVAILSVLLLFQVLFFARYYQSLKKQDIERVGDSMLKSYRERRNDYLEFKKLILQTEYTNDVKITLFYVDYVIENGSPVIDRESFVDILSTVRYGGITEGEIGETLTIDKQFFNLLETSESFTYISTQELGVFLVYGASVHDRFDGTVYFHVTAPLEISDFMLSTLRRMSVWSTIICAMLSFALAWFVSNRVARPVSEFSKTARRLAQGDYTVRFEGNGFSEIEQLAQTLNYATEEIGKTEQLRRDLLANVSHDLRTPLTMVRAYAEMIRDISGNDGKKRTSHSQTIIDEADRLTSLVSDISDLSKLQSGTAEVQKSRIDMSMLVRSVIERFDIFREKEGYVFDMNVEDKLEVFGDGQRLEQVLYNLIGNAINYTGEDKKISVSLFLKNGQVQFEVSDSGKGISKEDIENVWERYYRTTQSKRTRIGTGLGLSIVKNILVLHEAQYGINSVLGEGTTFYFCLPQYIQAS